MPGMPGLVRTLALSAVATASLLVFDATVMAKGPVDEITITGNSLLPSIEITKGEALLEFNPWAGQFLGPVVDALTEVAEPMQVTMYLADEAGVPQPIYRFTYYAEENLIYLPGPGDADFEINKGTIMTRGDGMWHEAAPAWTDLVDRSGVIQPPATGNGGLR